MQLSDTDIRTIVKIRQVIECGIFEHISISELCAIADMGKSKFSQAFYHLNQKTIYQYHLTISMEYAKSLLEEGRLVKELAILFGYKTSGHFSRAFVKVFRTTPGEFKAQNRA